MTLLQSQRACQLSARRRERCHAQIASGLSCNIKRLAYELQQISMKECRNERVSPASGGTQFPLPGWMDLHVALPVVTSCEAEQSCE